VAVDALTLTAGAYGTPSCPPLAMGFFILSHSGEIASSEKSHSNASAPILACGESVPSG